MIGVPTLGADFLESCRFASRGFSWLDLGFLSRDGRRRDSPFRFTSVVSNGIPRLFCAGYGVLFRRRGDWLRDTRRRFSRMLSCGVQRLLLA